MKLENISLKDAMEAKDVEALETAIAGIAGDSATDIVQNAIAKFDERMAGGKMPKMTAAEIDFWTKCTKGVKDAKNHVEVQNSIGGAIPLPETTIDRILSDLKEDHKLLGHLDIIHTSAKVKVLFANIDTTKKATWGDLGATITAELAGVFTEIEASAHKLSAWIPVPNYLFDLGAFHIGEFVITIIEEMMANGLEEAVLTNLKSNAPLGMIFDAAQNGTTASGVTTYKAKTAVAVTEWTPAGLANVIKTLIKTKNGITRNITGKLFLAVNADDYVTKVKPAICAQNALGEWVDRSPYAVDICPSSFVPSGKAIMGIDKQYALAICADGKTTGTIEYSDDYKFLEHVRAYRSFLYADGRPKDNNSFVYLDISGLKESALLTKTVAAGA